MESRLTSSQLTGVLSLIAYGVAAAVTILLPAIFFVNRFDVEQATLRATVEINAFTVTQRINHNPDMWSFEISRLQDLIDNDFTRGAQHEMRKILDPTLRPIVQSHAAGPLAWPVITSRAPLLDSGRIVGYYAAQRSVRGVLDEALGVALGGLVLGLAIALTLRVLPLRALRRAEASIAERTVALEQRNDELRSANDELRETQHQLVQSEKLASIGQLAAGVAHEINNPIGYVFSNFGTLERYLEDLLALLAGYEAAEGAVGDPKLRASLRKARESADLDFVKEDLLKLMSESKEGITRVKKIVQDLKDFSHSSEDETWQWASLHKGLDSTLNIVNNEIKYKADVLREYGEIPDIECLPSQINQVAMNLLVNAAHAIGAERGQITVRTGVAEDEVWFEIADNGCGIAAGNLSRIFDPFFTTKPVGKGTGLGLSLSYGIVKKHRGRIEVTSEPGRGSAFRVFLPVVQNVPDETLSPPRAAPSHPVPIAPA